MTEKHLNFLNYLLPILSKSKDGEFINSIASKYKKEHNISFDESEIDHFKSLYKNKYFTFPYSDINNWAAIITPETKEIIDNYGALSKYLNLIAESNTNEQLKLDNKTHLETDVLKLQKESFEHLQTIRSQESRIRDLEEQTKFIELLKGYWWVFFICLGIGTYIGTLLDKWLP